MLVLKYSKKNEVLEIFLEADTDTLEDCRECDAEGVQFSRDEKGKLHEEDCWFCNGEGNVSVTEEKLIGTCFTNAVEHGRMLEYVLNAIKQPFAVR